MQASGHWAKWGKQFGAEGVQLQGVFEHWGSLCSIVCMSTTQAGADVYSRDTQPALGLLYNPLRNRATMLLPSRWQRLQNAVRHAACVPRPVVSRPQP